VSVSAEAGVDLARRRWLVGRSGGESTVARVPPSAAAPATKAQPSPQPGVMAHCLALRRVECRSCGDACDTGALRFRLQRGAPAQPLWDAQSCTGCGDCLAVCPVSALCMPAPQPEQKT
jgi:ferredoxin